MIEGLQPLHVAREDDGALWCLTLNHGKANEVGSAVLDALVRLATDIRADAQSRALITWSTKETRSGTPVFVAGADVKEREGWTDAQVLDHVARQREVLWMLRDAPVFHAGVVSGVAYGWGCEYALLCDYVIATPKARFALPETGLGIVPGAGGTAALHRRVGRAQALRLGMTGEAIDAEEALRIGLVQELAPSLEDALARARALATLASRRSPTALAAYKRTVLQLTEDDASLEQSAYAACVLSGDAAVGREWFGAGRPAGPIGWNPRRDG